MFKFHQLFVFLVLSFGLSACTTYPLAENVKLISFEDNVTEGKSVGPIQGEDCAWTILGVKLGGQPTIDKAMASARTQSKSSVLDSFKGKNETFAEGRIRYMNNVSTARDGFNAANIVAKDCLIVKGVGYQ